MHEHDGGGGGGGGGGSVSVGFAVMTTAINCFWNKK